VECEVCKDLIDNLCQDKAFGILTRNGFEYKLAEGGDFFGYQLILMDFFDVSILNTTWGYLNVNEKFRDLFSPFIETNIIGRCFSGDEIIILTKKPSIVDDLFKRGNDIGLNFRYCRLIYSGNLNQDLEVMYDRIAKLDTC